MVVLTKNTQYIKLSIVSGVEKELAGNQPSTSWLNSHCIGKLYVLPIITHGYLLE